MRFTDCHIALKAMFYLLNVFPTAGVSIVREASSSTDVTLKLQPLYGSQFPSQEFHTVQLMKSAAKRGNWELGQCRLPSFVPIKQLAEEYLGNIVVCF